MASSNDSSIWGNEFQFGEHWPGNQSVLTSDSATQCFPEQETNKVGMILDISGSMSKSAEGLDGRETESWGKSIFDVIDQIIENDISDKHKVFAIGCGARSKGEIIDILSTISKVSNVMVNENPPDKKDLINECFDIIENDAKYIRRWANIDLVDQNVSYTHCCFLYKMLKNDLDFQKHFINKILPKECRNWEKPNRPNISTTGIIRGVTQGDPVQAIAFGVFSLGLNLFLSESIQNKMENAYTAVASTVRKATPDDIKKIIKESIEYTLKSYIQTFSANEASRILKGSVSRENTKKERYKKLHDDIRPVLYGATPLIESLNIASSILISPSNKENKFLFILSDGDCTDRDISLIRPHAYIIGCYISNKAIHHKTLFSTGERFSEKGAQFLYDISDTIQTQHLPRSIFISNDWTIDYKNGETKLFLQVNNPKNLDDACKFAKRVVMEHTALADALQDISLDIYIYQGTKDMKAKNQGVLPHCYAYAFATVIHVNMMQNPALSDMCPSFTDLCEEIKQEFNTKKSSKKEVVNFCCKQYQLILKKLSFEDALNEIKQNHLIVATFLLSAKNMDYLKALQQNEQELLKETDLQWDKNIPKAEKQGHAVVFTSYNNKCLTFMNSWGENWGYNGFFKVESSSVINFKYYKIQLDESKFSDEQRRKIGDRGKKLANDLLQRYKSLRCAKYTCPKCKKDLDLSMFKGTIHQTKCLSCYNDFSCEGKGNILVLNLYLNTL